MPSISQKLYAKQVIYQKQPLCMGNASIYTSTPIFDRVEKRELQVLHYFYHPMRSNKMGGIFSTRFSKSTKTQQHLRLTINV